MRPTLNTIGRWLGVVLLTGGATHALACTACFGQSDSEMAQGMNWGIYTLLGVIGLVLGCIATAVVVVGRRSVQLNRPESPISES